MKSCVKHLVPVGAALLRRRKLVAGNRNGVGCLLCWQRGGRVGGGRHRKRVHHIERDDDSAHTPTSSPHPTACRGEKYIQIV